MSSVSVIEDSSSGFDHLVMQIDTACLDFETDWSPELALHQIEATLAGFASDKLRPRLFRELVATDCELRSCRQMELDPSVFIDSFPEYASEVEAAFDLWKQTEQEFRRDTHPVDKDSLPKRIGDYDIIRELGRGGSSVVFEAIQPELDRRVALKTFVLTPVRAVEQRQRFALEVKAASLLEHEHIVSVYHSGESEGLLYYSMQYVDGDNFHRLIRQRAAEQKDQQNTVTSGLLEARRSAQAIAQATTALDYAHRQGVLHRDIKPANLLLDKSGNVRLTDFGLAQLANSDSQLTATGNVVGSIRYLAPEAFDGIRDERSDVYGLGLTLYEMLTLRPAFADKDHSRLVTRIQAFDVCPPRQIDKSIPKDLETITMMAMAADPSDRYASAREFGDDLKRFLAGKPIHARVVTPLERALKWLRRNPGVAAVSALFAMILFLGVPAFWLTLQGRELDRIRASKELAESELREKQTAMMADRERARATGAAEARADAEYALLVNAAQAAIEKGDYRTADQRINRYEYELEAAKAAGKVVADRRGWEWQYLIGLLDQSIVSIEDDPLSTSKLRLSPDEKYFVIVGSHIANDKLVGSAIKLRDAQSGKLIRTFADSDEIFGDACFSPDGSRLATISIQNKEFGHNGWVRLWDVESGQEIKSRKLTDDFPTRMLNDFALKQTLPQIQFDPSGKLLVTSAPVIAFDSKTLEPEWRIDGERIHVLGDTMAVFGQNSMRRHAFETGEPLSNSIETFPPSEFSLSKNDGPILHVSTEAKTCCELRDEKLEKLEKFTVPKSYWTSLAPDGKSLFRSEIGGEIVIQTADDNSTELKRLIGHQNPVYAGVFNRKGNRLITASLSGTIKIWDLEKTNANKVTIDLPKVLGTAVESLSFNTAGDRIHFASSSFHNVELCGSAKVDGSDLQQFQLETTNYIYWPRQDIGYSPDGSLLAAPAREDSRPESNRDMIRPSSSGRISVWSTDTNEVLQTFELGDGHFVTAVAFSQNNQLLAIAAATANEGPYIAAASVGVSSDVPIRRLSHDQGVYCMKFARNDQSLVLAETSGAVALLPIDGDGKPQQLAASPEPGTFNPSVVDVDSTGTRMAIAYLEGQSVRVFDIPTRTMKYETSLALNPCSVSFGPDGKRLAVAGQNSIVRLLATESGHTLLTLDGRSDLRRASPGTSIEVVFSPNGSRIATQGLDGRISVWNDQQE